ncbi:unnamed protein product, partial [Choristocarpus tenellus]
SSGASPRRSVLQSTVGLKEFMHRKKVLGIYRGILKQCARATGETTHCEISTEVRRQFRLWREETDSLKISLLVADAIKYMESMQGGSGRDFQRDSAASEGSKGSWLDIDDPEDPRGRVGTGFPWQR